MNSTASTFYVTGGTLRQDAACYVERQADKDLLEGLLQGEFCYVLTSRQMGKSSLMVRTAGKLREQRVSVVVLDLTAIGQNLTPEQWYDGLLVRMGRQLRLEDELEEFWKANSQLGPCQRFFAALRDMALARSSRRQEAQTTRDASNGKDQSLLTSAATAERLVLFVDEIDVVRSLPFSTDEFFAAIRECYNRRVEDAAFNQLTFCLLGVAAPSDLIRNTRLTPFNIGRRIVLNDFTAEEAAPLAEGLVPGARAETGSTGDPPVPSGHWPDGTGSATEETNAPGRPGATVVPSGESPLGTGGSPVLPGGVAASTAAQAVIERILHWTRGHPYLTQRLCRAVAEGSNRREEAHAKPDVDRSLLTSAATKCVDALCEELFFSARAREQDDNLLFVRERLLRGEADLATLLTHYEQIHRGRRVPDDETNPLVSVLRLSGVVRTEAGRLRERNRIYARVFDRAWVRANMPDAELRRQRRAFWRGAARMGAAASVVVALLTALAVYAIRHKRLAEAHLYVADMEVAQQAWEAGNLGRARELVAAHRGERAGLRGFEWRYLWKLSRGNDEFIFGRHDNAVHHIVFSRDGASVASVSGRDDALKLWDASTRQCRGTLHGARRGAVFLPDGRTLLWTKQGGAVESVDVATSQTTPWLTNAGDIVALLPDGRTLATTDNNHVLRLWDIPTRQLRFAVPGRGGTNRRPGWNSNVSFSESGHRVAAIQPGDRYEDEGITVWEVPSGKVVVHVPDRRGIHGMKLSPDGHRLFVGDRAGWLKVWNLNTTNAAPAIRAHSSILHKVVFSPAGDLIATCSSDQTIKLWTMKGSDTPRLVNTLRGHEGPVHALAFTPDGRRLFTGGRDQTIRVWKLDDAPVPDVVTELFDDGSEFGKLYFLSGSKTLVGGAANGVKIWDAERMQLVAELPGTNSPWAITADGRGIHTWVGDGVNRRFRLWDVATRAMVSEQSVVRQWPNAGMFPVVSWFELSPDGRILVVADDRSGAVQFWDALQWRELATRTNHTSTIRHVRFSRDSTRLFSCGEDGTVHLWDMRTLRSVAVLATNSLGLLGMALSPDERTLAVGSQDTRIYLWDWRRQTLLATLKGHRQAVISVAFSPDGKTLASSSSDGTVTLWHVPLRREIAKLRPTIDGEAIEEEVRHVSFSPDGNLLVARTYPGTLKVWRAASWEEIAATEAKEARSR